MTGLNGEVSEEEFPPASLHTSSLTMVTADPVSTSIFVNLEPIIPFTTTAAFTATLPLK